MTGWGRWGQNSTDSSILYLLQMCNSLTMKHVKGWAAVVWKEGEGDGNHGIRAAQIHWFSTCFKCAMSWQCNMSKDDGVKGRWGGWGQSGTDSLILYLPQMYNGLTMKHIKIWAVVVWKEGDGDGIRVVQIHWHYFRFIFAPAGQ